MVRGACIASCVSATKELRALWRLSCTAWQGQRNICCCGGITHCVLLCQGHNSQFVQQHRYRARRAGHTRQDVVHEEQKISKPGFDPGTFGLWAQHASHCATSNRLHE